MKVSNKAAYKRFRTKRCKWIKGIRCGNPDPHQAPELCVSCILFQLQRNFVVTVHFNEAIMRAAAEKTSDSEFLVVIAGEQAEKLARINSSLEALSGVLSEIIHRQKCRSNPQEYVS